MQDGKNCEWDTTNSGKPSQIRISRATLARGSSGSVTVMQVVPARLGHCKEDALRDEAGQVAEAVRKGARVMVCGGRAMAEGVSRSLDEILAPAGLTHATLKAQGRYVEDVF